MAADGQIKIAIEVDGKQVDVASKSLDNLEASGKDAGKGVKSTEDSLKGVGQESTKAGSKIKQFATALGLVAIGAAAFRTLKASMDAAITRFDTLSTFPKVLQALGVSAEDSQRAMSRLSDGIDGLPTTLNEIASTAQRMYTSFNDMDKATDTALALNNAMLGSGSSAADAQRGTEQYLQALQKGKFEMEEWKTLQETMDIGLIKVAESLGFVGKTAKQDLYKALKDNVITMDEFNDKLIEVGTGTGVMASLAKENSLGIATSLGNLKNAAAKGIASIIESFDDLSEKVTGKDIAQNIDSLKAVVNSSFKVIGAVIEGATPTVIFFASTVQGTIPIVKALTPAIIGLVAAYGAYTVISKAQAIIEASNAALKTAMATTKAMTLATQGQTLAQVLSTNATTADMVAKLSQLSVFKLSSLAIGVMTGATTADTAVKVVAAKVTYAFGAAIKFLMGPVGWVVAGIGLLVTGVIALVKWFNKSTEEGERLAKQTDELASSTESLNTAVEDSSRAYASNQKSIVSNAQAYKQTLAQIEELSAKENKSAEDKKLLNSYIEELNRNVGGLNLVYGEQSNALNMTSEQITNRINLMKEEQKLQASQERLTEIMKEQAGIGQQFQEVVAQREEWNQKLADGSVKTKEHKEAIEALEEQEAALSQANTAAGEERIRIENEIIASSAAVTDAMEKDIGRQLTLYDELSDSAKSAVESMNASWNDYKESATDLFDTLSDKSKLSVADMQKNLEENQRIITTWSENIAKLAERGVDEGLLNTLREAGPESAGHVNALVKASDEELKKLSASFAEGGKVATEALSTSLGIEDSGLLDAVGHLVTSTEKALAEKIKTADWEDLGVDIAKGQAKGIKDGTPEAEKAATEMAKATEDAAREQAETHSPSKVFMRIGDDMAAGLVLGLAEGTQAVLKSAIELAKNTLKPFKDASAEFKSTGKDAMAGFDRGLKAGEAQVLATARNIANSAANTMRKALDIHSPSRVFREIGVFVGKGLSDGIDSTKAENQKVINSVAKVLESVARENAKEVSRISMEAEKKRMEIQSEYAKKRAELTRKTTSSSQAALKTHKNKKSQIVTTGENKVFQIRQDAAAKLVKLNEEEQKKIIQIDEKARVEKVKVESELAKERLNAIKNYVTDKKSLEELSLVAESEVWRKSITLFKEGTKERVEAQKAYQSALQTINNEIIKINEEYSAKVQSINNDLANSEKKLNDEYTKTFEDRAKTIANFAGLFDSVDLGKSADGRLLIKNLQDQTIAVAEWSAIFQSLSKKAIDEGLLEELRLMGPKALPELRALNNMTAAELTLYSNLYKEKTRIARQQTYDELHGMRVDTEKRINELRKTANSELDKVQRDWNQKIKSITKTTDDELKSLKTIGQNAGQGLLNGLASMEPALIAKARAIAESIKAAMAGALAIHSPSRWMRDFIAGNMALGFIEGVDKNESKVVKAASLFGDMLKPDLQSVSIPNLNFRPFNPSFSGSGATGNHATSNVNVNQSVNMGEMQAVINIGGHQARGLIRFISNEQESDKRRNNRQIRGGKS